MMRLVWGSIAPDGEIPDFGPTFRSHLAEKKNPGLYAASLTAWRLLAGELGAMGLPLPKVAYTGSGKPYFSDFGLIKKDFSLIKSNFGLNWDGNIEFSSYSGLFFSLSHSGSLAAALISDQPCGVDIQLVRPDLSERLYARCMHPAEIAAGLDFFDAWTRKECLGKLSGSGLPSRPCAINSLAYEGWHTQRLRDDAGDCYVLSALCMPGALTPPQTSPES